MTDVVETFRKIGVSGGIKTILIQTSSAAATGHTIDLKTDATDGKGIAMTEVCLTLVQDDAGADKTATWDPDTGIVTLGSISTGIHNIMIMGY